MLVAVTLSGVVSLAFEVALDPVAVFGVGLLDLFLLLVSRAFVGGIATGSWLVHRGWVPGKDAFRQFGLAQAGIAFSVLVTLPFYDKLPLLVMQLGALFPRTPEAFYPFEAFKFTVCFLLMLAPATFIGMTLPLATRVVTRAVDEVGSRVGAVFSLNTLGNVVGALSAALVFLPWLGLRGTILAGVGVNVLIAGAMILASGTEAGRGAPRRRWGLATAAFAAFAAYVLVLPGWDMRLLDIGAYRQTRVGFLMSDGDPWSKAKAYETLFHRDDANATITVGKGANDLYLSTNGKVDASLAADAGTQKLLAHLPLMLKPAAKDVLVVGLGSGMTAGAVLTHPVSALDVVEISEGVVEANRFFVEANRRPLEDPRTRLHLEDAGSFLRLSDRKYDVVISEPSNPWVAGIGNLFSADFYQETNRHLKPGGLMVQWFHTYEIDDSTFQLVLRTFAANYKHVTMWQIQQADVMLVGSNEPIAMMKPKPPRGSRCRRSARISPRSASGASRRCLRCRWHRCRGAAHGGRGAYQHGASADFGVSGAQGLFPRLAMLPTGADERLQLSPPALRALFLARRMEAHPCAGRLARNRGAPEALVWIQRAPTRQPGLFGGLDAGGASGGRAALGYGQLASRDA